MANRYNELTLTQQRIVDIIINAIAASPDDPVGTTIQQCLKAPKERTT